MPSPIWSQRSDTMSLQSGCGNPQYRSSSIEEATRSATAAGVTPSARAHARCGRITAEDGVGSGRAPSRSGQLRSESAMPVLTQPGHSTDTPTGSSAARSWLYSPSLSPTTACLVAS